METLTPHSEKQEQAIFANSPINLVACGTQWGKTVVGAVRMKLGIHNFESKKDTFIITSPTYKTMMQSTLPPFLEMMKGMGKHHKVDQVFELFDGRVVYLRTETDPDSIVGITNVKRIWGDEAGKYRLYFWENMQARADFCGCPIDLTTSPYALNWVWRDLIKKQRAGLRPDLHYISAASWDNPYHSLHNMDKRMLKRQTMAQRRFDMIYGGEFGKMAGLVYDCFDEDANSIEPFALPPGTQVYGTVDWGFTHPAAITVRAITPDGNHYQVSEFKKPGLTIEKIMIYCHQQKQTWGIKLFWCGPDRPENIKLFNENGLPAQAANNDVQTGIDLHYELVASRRYKIFKGTGAHTIDEYETYHYPEPVDLGPDDNAVEDEPVGQDDDLVDSNRYGTIMTYKVGELRQPRVSSPIGVPKDESNQKRIARLKKSNRNRQTENF